MHNVNTTQYTCISACANHTLHNIAISAFINIAALKIHLPFLVGALGLGNDKIGIIKRYCIDTGDNRFMYIMEFYTLEDKILAIKVHIPLTPSSQCFSAGSGFTTPLLIINFWFATANILHYAVHLVLYK